MTKKKIEYFGYLKGEKLNTFGPEQKLNHFVTKKLFVATKALKLSSNIAINLLDSGNYKTKLEPSKELLDAYYTFLLHTYQEYINTVFIDFFHLFNNQIVGLKKKEAKMIGRLLFLNIINNTHSPNFDIVHMLENPNGLPKVHNTPKLELYFIKREALKNRALTEYSLGLDSFLMGNSSNFNDKLINDVPIIKEIIQFEGELKILMALNEEYQFEKHKALQPSIEVNSTQTSTPISKKIGLTTTMPTEEEMDAYLMAHVFSKKKN